MKGGKLLMDTHSFKHPILGQECVCPDGLGRVTEFRDDFPHQWVKVDTHYYNRSAHWDPKSVKLVKIVYQVKGGE